MNFLFAFLYLIAAVCFILALKGLASPATARQGNIVGMFGMGLSICTTISMPIMQQHILLIACILCGGVIGTIIALRVSMTAMPQLVAGFHSLVGLAAVLVAFCAYLSPESFNIGRYGALSATNLIEMSLGLLIGAITFSGSIIAFLKLQGIMNSKPIRFIAQKFINLIVAGGIFCLLIYFIIIKQSIFILNAITVLSMILGVLLIIPVGGADMPVVISMLNSYSGWAAAGIGFTLNNFLLIITGALVGASGAILSYIMCISMHRSIFNVIFSALKITPAQATPTAAKDMSAIHQANAEDAAFLLSNAKEVIIVPGYGMAIAHAQHAVAELFHALSNKNIKVRFAIHPVAGRMPGHMNVLLAEANIGYDYIFEQSEINRDFARTDVAFVIGANDITNPAAKTNPDSPLYGMPILEVENAKWVLFVKRTLAPGYAGVENDLFFKDNTYMLFGDAKIVTEAIAKAVSNLT